MVDSLTLRSEHLRAEIDCHRDEGTEAGTHCVVNLHFEDGDQLAFCESCLPEMLDLLTRAYCTIEDRKERSGN